MNYIYIISFFLSIRKLYGVTASEIPVSSDTRFNWAPAVALATFRCQNLFPYYKYKGIKSSSVVDEEVALANQNFLSRQKRFVYLEAAPSLAISYKVVIPLVRVLKATKSTLQIEIPSGYSLTVPGLTKREETEESKEKSNAVIKLEDILSLVGVEGRECIKRSICELTQLLPQKAPKGLIGELYHLALKQVLPSVMQPGNYNWNEIENDSYEFAAFAGRSGKTCSQLFQRCPLSLRNLFNQPQGRSLLGIPSNMLHLLTGSFAQDRTFDEEKKEEFSSIGFFGVSAKFLVKFPLENFNGYGSAFELAYPINVPFSVFEYKNDKYKRSIRFSSNDTHYDRNIIDLAFNDYTEDDFLEHQKLAIQERIAIYKQVEEFLGSLHLNARECLKRFVCEVSATEFGEGILDHIIKIVFSPSLALQSELQSSNSYYTHLLHAEEIGRKASCLQEFYSCNHSLLHTISTRLLNEGDL